LQEIIVNRLIPFDNVPINYIDEEYITTPNPVVVDEGLIITGGATVIDEGNISFAETTVNYRLEVWTDIFTLAEGEDDESVHIPDLVRQNRRSDLWVSLAPALYYRLRFIATDPDEFFRVNSMDLTVSYQGNLS
jgi:hypothetical protein